MDATDTSQITVAEAADILAVSERTVWRYLKSGRLAGTTVGEPGSQRTLIPRAGVEALSRDRAGADLASVRAECDRLAQRLNAALVERDALRGRVAALQSTLARSGRPARLERVLGGAMAAMARVRVG